MDPEPPANPVGTSRGYRTCFIWQRASAGAMAAALAMAETGLREGSFCSQWVTRLLLEALGWVKS